MGLFSMFGGRHVADLEGQVSAVGKSQAVIEFELDGTIRHADDNFLKTVRSRTDWDLCRIKSRSARAITSMSGAGRGCPVHALGAH
jgi:hypothetical protein